MTCNTQIKMVWLVTVFKLFEIIYHEQALRALKNIFYRKITNNFVGKMKPQLRWFCKSTQIWELVLGR